MLGNYLAAAIRNLLRNRAYTLINLIGLSLGFAAAILIALYVRDEYTFDRFIPDHERIYLLGSVINPPGRGPMRLSVTSVTDGPALQLDFPEIEVATRLAFAGVRLYRQGENEGTSLAAYWAETNFFEVFPLRVIAGNLAGALSQPDGLVLTRTAARRLFAREDVTGKIVGVGKVGVGQIGVGKGGGTMRVMAVVEDLPSNSHLNCEVFLPGVASTSALAELDAEQRRPGAIRSENVYTYVKLRAGASVDDVRARLRAFVDSHVTGIVEGVRLAKAYTFTLTPISDIHLQPRSIGDMRPPGDPRVVQAMIGIALLILIVACGNFVSMMTARATRRAVEVGVRKTVGATQRQIMVQFVGECLFYTALAVIAAVIAVELVLPAFNGFLQRQVVFDYARDPVLAAGLVGLAAITGLAAGAYPALYLSRFKPNAVLRGTTFLTSPSRVQQSLVIFQFATLIALLVATLTVQRQTRYAIEDRLRIPTDQIYLASPAAGCPRAFADSLRTLQHVRAASCVSDSALTFSHFSAIFPSPTGGNPIAARAAPIDYSFFDLFHIKPVAGRLLSATHGQDDLLRSEGASAGNPAVVINESAARALGFATPGDAIGKFRQWRRLGIVDGNMKSFEPASSEIVGVVPDFSIGSVRDAIEPTAYYVDPAFLSRTVLELEGSAVQEALASVTDQWNRRQSNVRFDGKFLSQYMNALYSDITIQSTIFAVFSGVAVVLAALGLLGLAIFAAERRTKEIGLRKVMGARRKDILLFLGWQFARPVLWANLIAWPCAYLVMQRWLQGFAYHAELGLLTFVVAGMAALTIALATVAGHAVMVARARPVEALRCE